MSDKEDYLTAYREFFENFAATVNPEDQLPVNIAGYTITQAELPGEVLYWITQYLAEKLCPPTLITPLLRIILEEVRAASTKAPNDFGYKSDESVYIALRLMQAVTARVNEICLRYLDNSRLDTLPPPPDQRDIKTVSCAVKNSRRVMEDRHVEIPNLEALFGIETTEPTSFYAVYDGHAGTAAAVYCAAHLHQYLVESPHFTADLRKAMRDAFLRTDADFVRKSNQERAVGGSTAVAVAVRGRRLLAAWAGDSQALLAKRMRLMQLVRPHKPSRQDERDRIESSGGTVMYWGTWRVNGQLAVSRAIGDAQYKPYVTARPEFAEVDLDGDEDFVVVACDGLWDFVSEDDVALAVYRQLAIDPDDLKAVTKQLVVQAKRQGSADNISIIVVFLKEPRDIAADNCSPMDLGLDNALANAPPFAMETESCKRLDASTNGQGDGHDNGVDHSDDSDSEDFGPETAVDIDADVDVDADDDMDVVQRREHAPSTPPAHTVEENHVDGGLSLVDNVAESGEDSEDEWNYFKGEGNDRATPSDPADHNPRSPTPTQDQDHSGCETSSVDMSSPLNPDAPVFVPTTAGDVLLAESPRKPLPMDDIELPDVAQFRTEAVVRPAELLDLDNCDQLNGHHNVSIEEKEHLNGNDKCTMDSLGFGFNVGVDDKPTDNGLIQDLQRIQKDTTDFCDIQVLQTQNDYNPFAAEGNEELVERLKNKERDPMSMSFYQEKDDDTRERDGQVDLNAVRPLPDSDSDEDSGSRDNIENIEPDNDMLGLNSTPMHGLERTPMPAKFSDFTGNNDSVCSFNNDSFQINNLTEVAPTDTPESHKLLFEQIPEIPDGKSSELGFTNDEGLDSERDQPSPQEESSHDVEMESKLESPSEEQHEISQELKEDQVELNSEIKEDLIETSFEPKAAATPEPEFVQNSHDPFESSETTADIHYEELKDDRLRGDVLETDLDAPEDQAQLIESQIEEQAFQFQSQVEAPTFQFHSEVPVETHTAFTESPLLEEPSPLPTQTEASPAPSPLPTQTLEASPVPSPHPAQTVAESPAASPLPAQSEALAPSPLPVQTEASPAPSPLPVQTEPSPAPSPLPPQTESAPSPAPSPLAQPLEPSPAPSPLPSEQPLPTSPTPPAESPAPAPEGEPTPAPDIVPDRAEPVTDLDAAPEPLPALATPPPTPAEPITAAPAAAEVAVASATAAIAATAAAAAVASATKKAPTSATKKAPTPKPATPKPAPKTSTTAKTPLSAKKPLTSPMPAKSPAAKTTPARTTPLAAKPAPITKPAAAKPASAAAKPAPAAAKPAPPAAKAAPAAKPAPITKPAPRPTSARAAPAAKPAAKEAAPVKSAPIARVAPTARPAPRPTSAPAAKPAPRPTTAPTKSTAAAPKPAVTRAPISRPAATATSLARAKPTAAADKKPPTLTNGDVKPAARPAPRPAPRAAPTNTTAAPKSAPSRPLPRARPAPDAAKAGKDLANRRITAKAASAPPAKAPSKPAPIRAPKKAVVETKDTNGTTDGPEPTLANGLDKQPPADPAHLPDVIA